MMLLSSERVSFLARQITERLNNSDDVTVRTKSTQLTASIIASFRAVLSRAEEIDRRVRRKIRSHSRPIPEGSEEWTILSRQYYEEELRKKGEPELAKG